MTALKDAYAMGYDLIQDLYRATGIPESWVTWPSTSNYHHLDALPVSITQRDGLWVVALDFDSMGDCSWSYFTDTIKGLAVKKLQAMPNLRQFARESNLNYSGVWRAKNDVGMVTERLIFLVGAQPNVVQEDIRIVGEGRNLLIEEDKA